MDDGLRLRIVEAAKNGFPWQAGVAAGVLERRSVPAGGTAAVNGKTLAAPAGGMTLIVRGRLREVSIVGSALRKILHFTFDRGPGCSV